MLTKIMLSNTILKSVSRDSLKKSLKSCFIFFGNLCYVLLLGMTKMGYGTLYIIKDANEINGSNTAACFTCY